MKRRSEREGEGEVFVPFVRLSEHAANWLTNNAYDRTSRIPEYKVCAVRLDRPGQAREWRRGRRMAPRPTGGKGWHILGENTVKRHLLNIYRKIGARRRADATAYALRHKLA